MSNSYDNSAVDVWRDSLVSKNVSISAKVPDAVLEEKPKKIFGDKTEDLNKSFISTDTEEIDLVLGDKKPRRKKKTTFKEFERNLNNLQSKNLNLKLSVVENASISKMLALVCFAKGNELEGCCHLIESHATCLRARTVFNSLKDKFRCKKIAQKPMHDIHLDRKDMDMDTTSKMSPEILVSTLKELPTEWHIVQLTAQHEHIREYRHRKQPKNGMYSMKHTPGLHVTVIPSGTNAMSPICVTLPKPASGADNKNYDICSEIESLLNTNTSNLKAASNSIASFIKLREKQDKELSVAISELEFSWLREWRILLLADYIEHLDFVDEIHRMVDKLIKDSNVKDISDRTRWLLRKLATGACHLQPFEIERAILHVLPRHKRLAINLILSILAKAKMMEPLKSAKRNPLILIPDERLDHLPFESVQLLKHQPVTRFPSLHIAYATYKKHENSIKHGYKILNKSSDNLGTFIVNPSLNLIRMEARIKVFLNYYLPKWEGLYGVKPDPVYFKNALAKYSILMYNGHRNGLEYLKDNSIEQMRVKAAVFLFGCSSARLVPSGGRLPPFGISEKYLMSSSPCVLGMLWDVTDKDTDIMTAKFMSSWIPSDDKRSWSDVDVNAWSNGKIEFSKDPHSSTKREEDMLVAAAKSRDACLHLMTSASMVLRGLPIKLVD